MIIEIIDKPQLSAKMKWDDVPSYYKELYAILKTKEGASFLSKFSGLILTETYTTQEPNGFAYAFLDGRKSIIREILNIIKVLDDIK